MTSRSKRRNPFLAVLTTPSGMVASMLLGLVLLTAVIAPMAFTDLANERNVSSILQGPSAEHWAGTDALGRDILLRVAAATGFSVGLALLATLIVVVGGVILGTLPLLVNRRVGRMVTSLINMAVAFPGLLLALFFAVIFGVGTHGAVLAIGIAGIPAFARLTQNLSASIAGRDFVSAARLAGVGRIRLIVRHVLPNIGEPLMVNTAIGAGSSLLAFSGLSFLGIGVQQPDYDWGRLLNEGLEGIYVNPMSAIVPGIAIVIAGLAFNLFGEAAARALGVTVPSRWHGKTVRASEAEDESEANESALLSVRELRVIFPAEKEPVEAVRGVSFDIKHGEAVGIVGESGAGKSLTALAIAQLVERPGVVSAARLQFEGKPLRSRKDARWRRWLGTQLAVIFQDPMASFTPTMRIGRQLAEIGEEHLGLRRRAALKRAVDRLRDVRLRDPERSAHQFPHELSGGMRQRAMIGMGLMGSPSLIVADEPTTALDATVQKQVLELLASIREADGVAMLLISHDITVIRNVCDRVLVMYGGVIVEDLPASELLTSARHPYTRALVEVVPDMETDRERPLPVIDGQAASASEVGVGCVFAARCPLADDHCRQSAPPLLDDQQGRRVACWKVDTPVTTAGAAP
ncbi:dipeptide/oligopeptide/nickel ABC transporter permease/ATP-binding protein [uncultured Agrococcus sp.]|uniref:dipeptide/oligopeptide/nickel ABC transporter permease/ATP-binding protein n=1 Tax=uncultured Agrococcus sp. TaxID=382258 RepID=UPI0025CD15D1|nr:dipeptide/oligopeptide/nickel ABC transporter permease/ATP-binding protein [uncultured Agrococcus sp.]